MGRMTCHVLCAHDITIRVIIILFKVLGGNQGGPHVLHHVQCGGGSSGDSMDIVVGRRRGKEGRVGKVGDTQRHHSIRG